MIDAACLEDAPGAIVSHLVLGLRADALVNAMHKGLQPPHFPMLGHVPQPLHAGRLEGDIRVEAASHGAVDDGLLLLVQQRDQLLLGGDVAADAPVRVIEEADDGGLFVEGRYWKRSAQERLVRQIRSREIQIPLERPWSSQLNDG